MGRRTACDIYWHGVSFHDNENIVSGKVNKFPGKLVVNHDYALLIMMWLELHPEIIKSKSFR